VALGALEFRFLQPWWLLAGLLAGPAVYWAWRNLSALGRVRQALATQPLQTHSAEALAGSSEAQVAAAAGRGAVGVGFGQLFQFVGVLHHFCRQFLRQFQRFFLGAGDGFGGAGSTLVCDEDVRTSQSHRLGRVDLDAFGLHVFGGRSSRIAALRCFARRFLTRNYEHQH